MKKIEINNIIFLFLLFISQLQAATTLNSQATNMPPGDRVIFQTNIGGGATGRSLFAAGLQTEVVYPRINADESVTWQNLAAFKTGLAFAASDIGLGNVENTALSTWAGSTNITTLGTITTGTIPLARIGSLGTNVSTFLGTPTSSNLGLAVTDETGTPGSLVFSNSPTLVTPNLGTPSAINIINATGMTPTQVINATAPGFYEDFEDNTRWTIGSTITPNVTMPIVGSVAWKIAESPSSVNPAIETVMGSTQGLAAVGDGVFYAGSTAPSSNVGGDARFTLGVVLANVPDTRGIAPNSFNISFDNAAMFGAGGDTILTGNVVHMNFSSNGVNTLGYFSGTGGAFVCKNSTQVTGIYPWAPIPPAYNLPTTGTIDGKFAILVRVEGNNLYLIKPGHGYLHFFNSNLNTHIGATSTNFWIEPCKGIEISPGVFTNHTTKILKVWGGPATYLDYHPQFGGYVSNNKTLEGTGSNRLTGTLELYKANSAFLGEYNFTQDYGLKIGGNAKSGADPAFVLGGNVALEGKIGSNLELTGVGQSVRGWADFTMENSITSILSSAAGNETELRGFVRLKNMQASDSQDYHVYGQLVGTNPKRILIRDTAFASTLFDSNKPSITLTNSTTTNTSTTITVSSSAGISVGWMVTGTGIQDNTRITNVNGDGVTLTLSLAATATGVANVTLNFGAAPLDAITGPYEVHVHRIVTTAASEVWHTKMILPNGIVLGPQRSTSNLVTSSVNASFRTTTVTAGAITIDGATLPVNKVVPR